MALATGALKKSLGTTITHVLTSNLIAATVTTMSGAALTGTAFTNTDGYLWCDVTVAYARNAAGTAGLTVACYRRYLDVKSTNDEPVPTTATFPAELVGVKLSENVTGTQHAVFENIWVGGRPTEFYLQNNTGQQINANWTLDITPFTFIQQV